MAITKIYSADGGELVVFDGRRADYHSAVHEEELMKSNFIRVSWNAVRRVDLKAGAYILYDGVKYRLFKDYQPTRSNERSYKYEPEFEHPVMWLSHVPMFALQGDTSSWATAEKKSDWTYSGYVGELVEYIVGYIKLWGDNIDSGFGAELGEWGYKIVGGYADRVVTLSFSSNDIMSVAASLASELECEYHFDYDLRIFFLGDVAYNNAGFTVEEGGDVTLLKTGENVGAASVSTSREPYCNCYLVKGGTKNLSQVNTLGERVRVVNRLTLDETAFPNSIIDLRGEDIPADIKANANEPAITGELTFDDVYPRLNMYMYGLRERRIYRRDESNNKLSEVYSKWYFRLASCETEEVSGEKRIKSFTPYTLTDKIKATVTAKTVLSDNTKLISVDMPFSIAYFTEGINTGARPSPFLPSFIVPGSRYVGAEFGGTKIKCVLNSSEDAKSCMIYFGSQVDANIPSPYYGTDYDQLYNSISVGSTMYFVSGINQKAVTDSKHRESDRIADTDLQINFIQNYDSDNSDDYDRQPLLGKTFDIDKCLDGENENEDNVEVNGSTDFITHDGEFRITIEEDDQVVIPHTSDGVLYPRAKDSGLFPNNGYNASAAPYIGNNIVSVIGIAVPDAIMQKAKDELKQTAFEAIRKLRLDNDSYTVKTYPDKFKGSDRELFVGQVVDYSDGHDLNDGTAYVLRTHIRKLVTQIDRPDVVTITVGNQKQKGNIESLKEEKAGVVYDSTGATGTGSGSKIKGSSGLTAGQVSQLIAQYGSGLYLSKVEEDTAEEEIGFLKGLWVKTKGLFGIDENGNVKAQNVTAAENIHAEGSITSNDLIQAMRGWFNEMRSENFSGHSGIGSGWGITNNYGGTSKSRLTIDEILVRGRWIVEELLVKRKEVTAGDQVFTCAANKIAIVRYFDNNGSMGYVKAKVPWLLGLKRLLSGDLTVINNIGKIFSLEKRIYTGINEEQLAQVTSIRCYFLASDGDKKVENLWKVGDLARCKTYNLTESTRNFGTHTGQVDWWRRVVAVSSSPETVDGKQYHWFEVRYQKDDDPISGTKGNSWTTNDWLGDSMLPFDGDDVVQLGHFPTDNDFDANGLKEEATDRMNAALIEVNGAGNEDAPCYKLVFGIYTFDMTKCWFGGPTVRMSLSPKTGYRFYGPSFQFIKADNKEIATVIDRDELEWTKIAFTDDILNTQPTYSDDIIDEEAQPPVHTRKDGSALTKVRKMWFFERISHKGSLWICTKQPETKWLQKSVNKLLPHEGHPTAYPTANDDISDFETILTYCTSEPSLENTQEWQRQVSKGTSIVSETFAYACSPTYVVVPEATGQETLTWYATEAAMIAAQNPVSGWWLYERRTVTYSDTLKPQVTYSVRRMGIDGDGIAEINSYYLGTDSNADINAQNDRYPIQPRREDYDTQAAYEAALAVWTAADPKQKWFDTYADMVQANSGIAAMGGWYIWEKTLITYDTHYTADNVPPGKRIGDLIIPKPVVTTYKCNRMGTDAVVGQEEYYMLASSNDFKTVFGNGTTIDYSYAKTGIRWYNQNNPGADKYRLAEGTEQAPNINTQMWTPLMPTYNKATQGNKIYLWNFEWHVDGNGTEYAMLPICIGNHARGIVGVIELYALSASQTPKSSSILIPEDLYTKNGYGTIPTTGMDSDKQVWSDEKYDRAPTDALPYQWNWTRTIYSTKDASGKDYEDHYHVSAVKGTKGEDGAGTEYIYKLSTDGTYGTHPKNITKDKNGTERNATYIATHDDFVPYGWTDNPTGISKNNPIELVSQRTKVTGGNWGAFSDPQTFSHWGRNGEDGDGVEYVFIRTATNVAPTIVTKADNYTDSGSRTFKDDEFLPKAQVGENEVECTDDPVGTTSSLPFEWVSKRTKGAANGDGVRQWEKYRGTMALWANLSENGVTPIAAYRWYKEGETVTKPTDTTTDEPVAATNNNANPTNKWSKSAPNRPADGWHLWMITSNKYKALDGTITRDAWSDPVRISGATGSAGEDGKEREWIYRKNSNAGYLSTTGTANGKSISGKTGDIDNCRLVDDFVPTNWNDNPTGVSASGDSEYASWRDYDKETNMWGTFHTPIVWSHYGERGMDGDGVEYVFIRTKTNSAPSILNDNTYTDHNGHNYTYDEHIPCVNGNSNIESDNNSEKMYECTDDPKGTTSTWKYEWVAKRTKGAPVNGVRTWEYYSGAMALWSKWADDGTSPWVADLDNEMDSVACDVNGKVSSPKTVKTNLSLYYGSTAKNFKITSIKRNGSTTMGTGVTVSPTASSSTVYSSPKELSVTYATTASIDGKDDFEITLQSSNDSSIIRTLHLTINGVRPGPDGKSPTLFQLVPSTSTIKKDGTTMTPNEMTCDVQKTTGNSAPARAISSDGTLYYLKNGDITSKSTSNIQPLDINTGKVTISSSDTFVVFAFFVGDTMVDKERVPVVSNGNNAPYDVLSYARCTSNAANATTGAPTGTIDSSWGSSGWGSTAPAPTDTYPYIWERIQHYNSSGTLTGTSYVCVSGKEGPQGNAITFKLDPIALILTQSETKDTTTGTYPIDYGKSGNYPNSSREGTKYVTITAYKNGTVVAASNQSVSSSSKCTAYCRLVGNTIRAWVTEIDITNGNNQGSFVVSFTANGTSYSVTVPWYANLLGSWKQTVENGVETSIATQFGFTDDSGVITDWAKIGTYIRGYEAQISSLQSIAGNILDCADGVGWRIYSSETFADCDTETQRIYIDGNDGATDIMSSEVFLVGGTQYVFSAYCNMSPNFYYLDCGNDSKKYSNFEDEQSINSSLYGNETYQGCRRYYGNFTPEHSGYYRIEVYNSSSSLNFYRPQLQSGETPTAWSPSGHNYSSEIKQTAKEIDLSIRNGLTQTGINITDKKINVKADNFTIKNNAGNKVLGTDANGNLEVTGTIRAKNFFHNVCVITGLNSYSYKKYYSNGTYSDNSSGQICTYDADVILVFVRANGTASEPYVVLPDPQDFPGKMVTISSVYNTNSSPYTFYVKCLGNGNMPEYVTLDNNGNIVYGGQSWPIKTRMLTTGMQASFISLQLTSGSWVWAYVGTNWGLFTKSYT